ncbi:LSU ribosomal protein L13p (L13Ae) [hydrothermal vent metagenome]|uniref:LSU ribosomal protein L13p (L13Ae) n=1 Tax=hydrothermal vent metagenome TaxID=652676 RepID=A0A3B1E5T9_9ZZZZ
MSKFTKMINNTDIHKDWIVIDASGRTFGRIITEIATILRGKNKPYFTPNIDCGDNVIVINATKAKFSGNKMETKEYFSHSGYFGSTKTHKMSNMLENNPEKLFKLATRGMLPKTKLGAKMLKNLKVYTNENHPHTAQVESNGKKVTLKKETIKKEIAKKETKPKDKDTK